MTIISTINKLLDKQAKTLAEQQAQDRANKEAAALASQVQTEAPLPTATPAPNK